MRNKKTPLIYRNDLKAKARENRSNPTKPEIIMWGDVLRDRQMLGYKFLRQKPIGKYILDFYCSELKLAVEIDGDSHAEQEKYDKNRTKNLNQLGIKVLRYTNQEVMHSSDGLFEDLEDQIRQREGKLNLTKTPGRQNPLNPPHKGDFNSEKYFKKAHFWAGILSFCPGVRAIFLSGSVAQGRGAQSSDIDIFIIARYGQIWTARFFVFVILKCFSQLAKEHDHAGKVCPNHFITDKDLEIQEKDAYAANLFSHNVPLYDPGNLWGEFVKANEGWVKKFGKEFESRKSKVESRKYRKANAFEMLLEQILKKLQIKKIKSNPEYSISGAKIVLEDTELRFHPKPKNKGWKK